MPSKQGKSEYGGRNRKMIIIETIPELRQYLHKNRTDGNSIGFVPTMGCLHQGHCALIRRSAMENDVTVLSIFLNPTQFSCREDYASYPRCREADLAAAEEAGATVVFTPDEKQLYPNGFQTYVDVQELSKPLCGEPRPGHFIGMATIVLKLFNIVGPCKAYFGQKDYQQVCIVKQMVRDLHLEIEIISCPTVREACGLACSSRNARLSAEERIIASEIYRLLEDAADAASEGLMDASTLYDQISHGLRDAGMEVEYVELVDANTLLHVDCLEKETLIAVAVFIGATRLIDNILIPESKMDSAG